MKKTLLAAVAALALGTAADAGAQTRVTLKSAQTALESNRLGLEVGVRTNLDVLTVTQALFQVRRDLAQSYFNYLIGVLRLRASIGQLTEQDLENINRRLR